MPTVRINIVTRADVDNAFRRIRTAASDLGNHIRTRFGTAFASVRSAVSGLPGHFRSGFSRIRSSVGSFMGDLRTAVTTGFSALRDAGSSLATSIGGAFRSAGSSPYVAAGIAALVITVAPAIGAALAGAITLAFGGAFVGLGVFLLKDNDKVKSAWGKTISGLKKDFSHAADGLIPVVTHAADLVGKMGDKFAPAFKKAMDDAAPHLTTFLDKLSSGIEKFGSKAFKPMMKAFNDLLDSIDLESFFGSLGDSFAYLGKTVSDNKKQIGLLFNLILGSIPIAVRIIAFLAQVWGANVDSIKTVIKWVKEAVAWIKKFSGKTVKFAQQGADTVVAKAKEIWKRILDIKNRIVSFGQKGAETVVNKVNGIINTVKRFVGKTVSIGQKGAASAQAAVQGVINKIRSFVGKSVSVGVRGATAAAQAVQSLINKIRNLVGKTVSIGVNFFKNAGGKLASALGFAHGGVVGHAAEGGPRSALTLVGEQGPELVNLAPGSTVRSNPDTRRLLSSGGSGGTMHITLQIGDKKLGDLLIDPFRKTIRTRGGNVQAVLGTGG